MIDSIERSKLLGKRYGYDGTPLLSLNPIQTQTKLLVEKKVNDGTYQTEHVPCSICEENYFELLAQKDRYGLKLSTVVCKNCGFIQTNPRMNQDAYNEFYDKEYRKLYLGEETPTEEFFWRQYEKGRQIYNYILDSGYFANLSDLVVFEVGCGAGGILHFFREHGCTVKGVDIGTSYLSYGKHEYNLDLHVGIIDSVKFERPPNLIIYSHVLEHILTPNKELRKIYNFLSNSGALYIEVPGVKHLMNSYELDFLRYLQNAHVYHFTLRSLKNLLQSNGYEILTGNEVINSIFVKSENVKCAGQIENDYLDVIRYLHKVEILRVICPIPPYKFKMPPNLLLIKILQAIGIYSFTRRVYRFFNRLIPSNR